MDSLLKTSFTYQLLADLLSNLKAQGFPVGTRKYLKVQELVRKLPEDTPTEQLKSLLCPLFAQSPAEQQLFYNVFDQSLNRTTFLQQPSAKIENRRRARLLKYLIWFLTIVAAFFTGILIYIILNPTDEPEIPKPEYIHFKVPSNASSFQRIKIINNDTAKVRFIALCEGHVVDKDTAFGTYLIDTIRIKEDTLGFAFGQLFDPTTGLRYLAKDTVGTNVDTICVEVVYHFGKYEQYFIPSIVQTEKEDPLAEVRNNLQQPIPLPFAFNITDWQIDPKTEAQYAFYKKNAWWLKLCSILLLGLIFGAIIQWLQAGRRVMVAELAPRTKGPYLWNIQIEGTEEDISFGNDYDMMLNQLRRRAPDERMMLHIPQTIKATIQKGGMLDVMYQRQTRPPEYLMLIERPYVGSHQARLFNLLYENLKANEVFIERFFYRTDLRLCYNENFQNGIYLAELHARFPNSRLLVFGKGYQLLSPVTGKPANWTTLLQSWNERFLFTSQPLKAWTNREKRLSQILPIMPASIGGIQLAIEQLDSEDEPEFEKWRNRIRDVEQERIEIKGDLLRTLEDYFAIKNVDGKMVDNRMVKWIAACAIYPSLHWDLTLYLGKLLSEDGDSLLTWQNLHKLSQLSWFIEGKIPEEARQQLLKYLNKKEEITLRRELQNLFKELPKPPENSVAFEDHELSVSVNDYLLTRNSSKKEELEMEVAQLLASGAEPDMTVIKHLERPNAPNSFKVPKIWKHYIDPNAKPPSLEEETLLEKSLYFVLGLLTLFIIFFSPSLEVCSEKKVVYQGIDLCLEEPEAKHDYWQQLATDSIHAENHDAVFRFLDSVKTLTLPERNNETISLFEKEYLKNIATEYHNRGVLFYNLHLLLQDSLADMPVPNEKLRQKSAVFLQKSCTLYDYAVEWDSSNPDFTSAIGQCKGTAESINFEAIKEPRFLWCLDNAHGSYSQGRVSPAFPDGSRLKEYELTRDIVNRISSKLERLGVQYFEVMPLQNVDDALNERIEAVNNVETDLQKMYIGLHVNTGPAKSTEEWSASNGIETWYRANHQLSKELAAVFQTKLVEETGWRNRQIKFPVRGFKILQDIDCPGIQTENGFYNNKEQALELRQTATREAIANAHVAAILEIEKNGLPTLSLPPATTSEQTSQKQSTPNPPQEIEQKTPPEQITIDSSSINNTSTQQVDVKQQQLSIPKRLAERIEIYEVAGRKGLKTSRGVLILKPIYNNIEKDPETGLYRVQKDRKFGYVNELGKTVIPRDYSYLGFVNEGLIRAEKDFWGYIDIKERIVIPFQFETAENFENGEAVVSKRVRIGKSLRTERYIINKKGERVRDVVEKQKY